MKEEKDVFEKLSEVTKELSVMDWGEDHAVIIAWTDGKDVETLIRGIYIDVRTLFVMLMKNNEEIADMIKKAITVADLMKITEKKKNERN